MKCSKRKTGVGGWEKDDVSEGIQTNGIAVETGGQLTLYSTGSPSQRFPWHIEPVGLRAIDKRLLKRASLSV